MPITANPQFNAWFKGSKVVNQDGSPKVVYHGTGADIAEFKYEFTGNGNDQWGSGFYFTDSADSAERFAGSRNQTDTPKAGGEYANVMPVYLRIVKPIHIVNGNAKERPLTVMQIRRIIMTAPDLDDVLTNFGDVEFEGRNKVINDAVNSYSSLDLKHQLFSLNNDFFRDNLREFYDIFHKATGYDGIVIPYSDDVWNPNQTHYVAWFPSQIKSAIGNKGTFDRKSNRVIEASSKLLLYHGTDGKNIASIQAKGLKPAINKPRGDVGSTKLAHAWLNSDKVDALFHALGEYSEYDPKQIALIIVDTGITKGIKKYPQTDTLYTSRTTIPAKQLTIEMYKGSDIRKMYIDHFKTHGNSKIPMPYKVISRKQITETISPQFKAWFGKSLVVDKNGKPLRVYHGSDKPEDFDVFKHTKSQLNQKNAGYFFTDDPKYASEYSGLTSVGSKTIPVYLRLEHPMSYDMYVNLVRYGTIEKPTSLDDISKGWANARTVDITAVAKKLGYDGVITDKAHEFGSPDIKGTPATFIVFSPSQIKSAISNSGRYNPDDERITESSEYRQESSDSVPLFTFMTESKAFRNEEMMEKYSTKELGEILFAMMLTLQLLGSDREEVKKYCIKTLRYPKFDHIFLSSTDLSNVITTLRNAREYLQQPNIDIPVNELKRFLRGLIVGGNSPAFVRALFFRLQTRLRIKDARLLSLRRELVDGEGHGDDLSYGKPLYDYLRRYQNKCDVLALLQLLMDRSLNESVKTNKGDCFKDSFSAIASGNAPGMKKPLADMENVRLVHGMVDLTDGRRGDHAWIEFSAGKYNFVWEPQSKRIVNKEDFYKELNAEPLGSYTQAKALGNAIRAGHSGPWPQEPKKLFTEIFGNKQDIE